uniref:Proline-rich peptide 10a n=1 Tax=Bitis rhinoceros TaxID=715877 RepID=BPPAC_BITRH
QNWPHPQVPP